MIIRDKEFIRYKGARQLCRLELDLDTVDELPEVTDIDGIELFCGSTAHVIGAADIYELTSEGEWIKQN